MDVLHDHLVRARASGGLFARSDRRGPWGLALDGDVELAVHAIVDGHAKLWLDEPDRALDLRPGDVVLVRGGIDHHLADEVGRRCVPIDEFVTQEDGDESAPRSVFLCGAYTLSGDIGRGLVEALPEVLHVRPRATDRLRQTVELLSWELAEPAPAQQTVLDRLLDVLLVQLLRASFDSAHDDVPRWYPAAADERVGPALRAIHADPAHDWSVAELAAIGHVSRATFARAFFRALGQTPMQYVADWRMALARESLRDATASLGEVAEQVGYGSAYAFASAFRRHHGIAPGRWRAQQRSRAA